ncbi:Transposase IS200 like [Micromonospora viridifaciens]|uniref:Transposase IS200 like n=2 Tax=Micromonospora viridifaciens TaxID=1881 RepID=A0A1C4WCZ2_MICVI|nr:IS200/IS605 family transposase [Micromonospora viridifaciens]SCE94068.1 Transposase IS200 like [Micromonospora viridifaciens]
MRQVCEQFECELVEFNGKDNHIHLQVNFPPKVALTKLVNSLKGVSSRYLRRDFPELHRYYWRDTRLMTGSYFAGPSQAHPRPSYSSTSSSRAAGLEPSARDGLPTGAFTPALKAEH